MDQKMSMEINGRDVHFLQGQTVLEVCREAGIYIPTMCHDERLQPFGA